ncbi:MAG TPA: DUF4296 domain-containing protein [Tenuifilaceae bacterium]|nr:DUF4296 domain-containing protein [Tenuifilaceae bacterium]
MELKFKYWVGFITIFFIGCSGNPIIPQRDMVLILKQIYITDGVVSISESNLGYKDSIAYYEPILKKYGYTTAEFDSSIKYYSQRTEELDEIFDKVILQLSKQQEEIAKDSSIIGAPIDSVIKSENNLWPHKTKWDMTIDHTNNPSLSFSIPVIGKGIYTVSFDAQIFPQDKSEETRTYLYFYYDDKSQTGNRSNVISEYYVKDSTSRSFKYKLEFTDSLVTHLNGALYEHGGERKNLIRRAIFDNISITYEKSKPDSVKVLNKRKPKFRKIQKQEIQTNVER